MDEQEETMRMQNFDDSVAPRYEIHFRRDIATRDDYVLIATAYSLRDALDKRICSGDLVVDATTKQIVRSHEWLWDWERTNLNCYAQRAIRDPKA